MCVPGAPAVHALLLLLLLEVSSSKLASWASPIRLHIPYVHEPAGLRGLLANECPWWSCPDWIQDDAYLQPCLHFTCKVSIRGLTLDRIWWLFKPCWETQVIGTLCACAVAPSMGCRRLPPACGGVCAHLCLKKIHCEALCSTLLWGLLVYMSKLAAQARARHAGHGGAAVPCRRAGPGTTLQAIRLSAVPCRAAGHGGP